MSNSRQNTNSSLWRRHPWAYGESFVLAISLMAIGFALELATPNRVSIPSFPINVIFIIILLGVVAIIHFFFKTNLVKWISSAYTAIASIVVFTTIILLMGFIPQNENIHNTLASKLGLHNVQRSWPYLLLSCMLIINLSFVILDKLKPFHVKNISFLLNHFGLWIVIVSASMGEGDAMKLKMIVNETDKSWTAYDKNNTRYELPFAIHLKDFEIEEYMPDLVVTNDKGEFIKKITQLSDIPVKDTIQFHGETIVIDTFYRSAVKFQNNFYSINEIGSAPAAFIKLPKQQRKDWIHSGSFTSPPQVLKLKKDVNITLSTPGHKSYISHVKVYEKGKEEIINTTISVNNPLKVAGWNVYQHSYNEKMGKFSTYSIFELVKDPWLKAVYAGMFMILTGTLLMLWKGKNRINI